MNRMYTPAQLVLGTLLAGPMAAVYFLKSNFDVRGRQELSQMTLVIGSVLCIFLVLVTPFLPNTIPNWLIPMFYTIPTALFVKKNQLTKAQIQNSEKYEIQPDSKVLQMGAVWLCVFGGFSLGYHSLAF